MNGDLSGRHQRDHICVSILWSTIRATGAPDAVCLCSSHEDASAAAFLLVSAAIFCYGAAEHEDRTMAGVVLMHLESVEHET